MIPPVGRLHGDVRCSDSGVARWAGLAFPQSSSIHVLMRPVTKQRDETPPQTLLLPSTMVFFFKLMLLLYDFGLWFVSDGLFLSSPPPQTRMFELFLYPYFPSQKISLLLKKKKLNEFRKSQ